MRRKLTDVDRKLISNIKKANEKECVDDYVSRLQHVLPNFPEEVLREWLHRHNDAFIRRFSHHDLFYWDFELTLISNSEIINIQLFQKAKQAFLDIGLKLRGHECNRESEPGKFMIKNGTFPSPIIIFNEAKNHYDFTGEQYLAPYHLAEGHKRWGYLNAMIQSNTKLFPILQNKHQVYLINFKDNL
jgi:hypothetical protein